MKATPFRYHQEMLHILFVQKRLILRVAAAIFAVTVLIAFFWPKTYAAYGSILVRGKNVEKSPDNLEAVEIRFLPVEKGDLQSEAEIFTSIDVIKRTIQRLQENGVMSPPKDASRLTQEIYRMKGEIKTQVIPGSNVIEVTYLSKDRQKGVETLSLWMKEYVGYRREVYQPTQTLLFFGQEVVKLREGLEQKQAQIIAFLEKVNLVDPKKEIDSNMSAKEGLEGTRNRLLTQVTEKKMAIQYLEEAIGRNNIQYFKFVEHKAIREHSKRLLELYVQPRTRLSGLKTQSSRTLDAQSSPEYQLLMDEVKAFKDNLLHQLEILNGKVRGIEGRIHEINSKNIELQRRMFEFEKLKSEEALLKHSYRTFLKRSEEARIDQSLSQAQIPTHVSILSQAFPSNGALYPRKRNLIPIGMILGLMLGCAVGFIREFFDDTCKWVQDIDESVSLPVLFSIPVLGEIIPKTSLGPSSHMWQRLVFSPSNGKRRNVAAVF